jgi:FG-GAP-like repeat/ASPIC and UnbV
MKRFVAALGLGLVACAGPAGGPPRERGLGTERMVQRLALIRRDQPAYVDPFRNAEKAERLLGLPLPANPVARREHLFELSHELLWSGRTEEAIATLERLLDEVRGEGAGPDTDLEVLRWLAVAHLRLGEQRNCIDAHGAASCLLPIRGGGVHVQKEPSRTAKVLLEQVLSREPDDLVSRWLLNLAVMTLGEYPRGVDPRWLIPPQAFESEAALPEFPDTAPVHGLATVGLAGGSVVEDLNGDGLVDVMVSSWGLEDPLTLLLNDGSGSFTDHASEAGLDGLTGGLNLVPADYDNDGDVDVLVLRGAWLGPLGNHPNSLLRNDGSGRFDDVTEEVGLLSFSPTQTAAWGDYDNDGWLDLFVGAEATGASGPRSKLYHNEGNDSFRGVETVTVDGFVKGAVWGDYDNDGWIDLYVSRYGQSNLLLRNGGPDASAKWIDVTEDAGVAEPLYGFPTWFFDYDNDGWLDLFVATYPRGYLNSTADPVVRGYLGHGAGSSRPRLYRNRGDGTFADVTKALGLDRVLFAMGANFGDLDNDGWLDFYVGTGSPSFSSLIPNRMFLNLRGERFADVTAAGGFGHLQKGHAVSFVDIDGDGDQDVFSVIGGAFSGDSYANVLFENPGNDNSWLTLRLRGTTANRSAIGARVKLVLDTPSGRREVYRTIGTGGSFGANSLQAEIGLGQATVAVLEVLWPGDPEPEVFGRLEVDQLIEVEQGASKSRTDGV